MLQMSVFADLQEASFAGILEQSLFKNQPYDFAVVTSIFQITL